MRKKGNCGPHDGDISFEGDETPVGKSLSDVVLGSFELKRMTQAGDFEFQVSSSATVRPLAEVMIGGTGGIGAAQTITYTETRYIATATLGQTVTRTIERTITKTVVVTQPPVGETTTFAAAPSRPPYYPISGIMVQTPYDSFVFIRGA